MPLITDYASLSTAITDFSHRSDLAAYVDYFIQQAQEMINRDIFRENMGNGIRYMENGYPATAIANGVIPVPSDWLSPKLMTVTVGSQQFPLIFKSPAWIYDLYSQRQASGVPQYIARDTSSSSSFPSTSSSLKFTATASQTVFSLAAGPTGAQVLFVALDGALLVPTTDYTVVGTTLTLTNGALVGQTLFVQYLAASVALTASNTSAFIFGPYPDSAYTVQGTYYQLAPLLSGSQTTNWMVTNAPTLLHAACMMKAQPFLKDPESFGFWSAIYKDQLDSLITGDKAERWASTTLQMELG